MLDDPSNFGGLLAVITFVVIIIGVLVVIAIWRNRSKTEFHSESKNKYESPGKKKDVIINAEPAVVPKQPVVKPEVPPGHIFISYRRTDSADVSGRIYDRLIGKFGKGPVFKDVDSIPLGLDFKEYLDKKVGECTVLLAIMVTAGWRQVTQPGKNGSKTRPIL